MNATGVLGAVIVLLLALAPKDFFRPMEKAQAGAPLAVTAGPGVNSGAVKSKKLPKFNPAVLLKGQNFIHGVPGTVSGSLRNANLQIRSDPPINREPVSIFNQSTITRDVLRPQVQVGRGTKVPNSLTPA